MGMGHIHVWHLLYALYPVPWSKIIYVKKRGLGFLAIGLAKQPVMPSLCGSVHIWLA